MTVVQAQCVGEAGARALGPGSRTASAPAEAERQRIAQLAQDIAEIRPLLVRRFPRSNAVIEIPGAGVARFGWDTLFQIGLLQIAADTRELLNLEERGLSHRVLSNGADGPLRCNVRPWPSVTNFERELPFPALSVGRWVLSAVHEKLFSVYDRMNVAEILSRWRAAPAGPQVEEAASGEPEAPAAGEAELIAASIALGYGALEEDRRTGRVTSSLRLSTLRRVLKGHFGCEARSCNGSELVLYRPGGQHAFISRRVSNPLVPAIAIQRILKELGIGVWVWGWLQATTRST